MVTTQVAPEPPRFWARPSSARGHLALAGLAAHLDDEVADLRHAGGAHRVALGFQAAAGVHGFRAVARGASRGGVRAAFAARDEAEVFERDDLGDGEAVVQLAELDFVAAPRRPSGRPFAAARRTAGKVVMSSFWSSATESDAWAQPSTRTGLSVKSEARSAGASSTAAAPSLISEQS